MSEDLGNQAGSLIGGDDLHGAAVLGILDIDPPFGQPAPADRVDAEGGGASPGSVEGALALTGTLRNDLGTQPAEREHAWKRRR